jgi:hypothetical protein
MNAYFYRDNSGKEIGPLDLDTLAKLRAAGVLNENTLVRSENSADWKSLKGLLPASSAPQIVRQTKKSINWTWAGLLAAVVVVIVASHFNGIQHTAEAEQAFRAQMQRVLNKQGIEATIISFKPISGASFVQTNILYPSGIESYKLKFEAGIEFETDKTLPNLNVNVHQGDRAKYGGTMIGDKTQNGWEFGFSDLQILSSSPMSLFSASENLKRAVANANACINNLRQIETAKNQWALENRKTTGTPVTAADIAPYIKNGKIPPCPDGGVYTLNNVGDNPT